MGVVGGGGVRGVLGPMNVPHAVPDPHVVELAVEQSKERKSRVGVE